MIGIFPLLFLGLMFLPAVAFASVTMPATVDLTPILTFGGIVVGALVGLLVLRKAIKTVNRS